MKTTEEEVKIEEAPGKVDSQKSEVRGQKSEVSKKAEKAEAKDKEADPQKKRKGERQEESVLSEDKGESIEVKTGPKAEMAVKIQNGHVYIYSGKVEFPTFKAGDTITINYKIQEGNKVRIQQFEGVVMQRKGNYTNETCTVRKVSGGVGVERIFPLHSPFIDKIVVNKKGKVRRARIFYLSKLKGKKARIGEKKG